MGRAEFLVISSLLRQTLIHLLKSAIEPDSQAVTHWFDEIVTFQGDAVLALSPGLRPQLDLEKIWRVACNAATRSLAKHGVVVPQLPSTCPFSPTTCPIRNSVPKQQYKPCPSPFNQWPSKASKALRPSHAGKS